MFRLLTELLLLLSHVMHLFETSVKSEVSIACFHTLCRRAIETAFIQQTLHVMLCGGTLW